MSKNNGDDEDSALRARLDKLGGALKAQRPEPSVPTQGPAAGPDAMGSGMAMAANSRITAADLDVWRRWGPGARR